jgi:diguanylate cyclase (GGDEF)-like protein
MPGLGFKRMSVANRVLLSFLVAAVLPLLLLAGSAYRLAESRLQDAALRDAHELAKSVGMDVYERLRFTTDQLTLIARGLRPGDEAMLPLRSLELGQRMQGLFRIGDNGQVSGALANGSALHEAILAEAADTDAALPLLVTYGDLAHRRLFLLVPDPGHDGARLIGAELNLEHLWDTAGIANRAEAVCILGPDHRPVHCNRSDHGHWLDASLDQVENRARPAAVATPDGQRVLTAAWPLFLKPHYQFDRWTFVVGIPQDLALRSIAAFDQVFGGVVILGLLTALWLGRRMIRSNLMPLQQLSEATRQLAAGDFSRRIGLRSGDEFEQLGSAFDRMAEQIGRQFDELDALAGLDRRLQLATDYEQMTLAAALCFDRLLGPGRTALVCHERGPVMGPLLCRPFGAPAVSQCKAGSTRMSRHQLVESMFIQLSVEVAGDLEVIGIADGDMIAMAAVVRAPSPAELKLIKRVNDVLSIALQNLAMERSMAHRANHDWLTGLPNRLCLASTFDRAVERQSVGHSIGLLMLGINRFKQINDSIGHAGGDGLLAKVGRRLRGALPSDVILTRFSGDQFVAMIDAAGRDEVEALLRRLADDIAAQLDQPIVIGPRNVRLTATMGAAVYPGDADDFDQMLQCLDAAMHTAKTERRSGVVFFTRGMRDKLSGRMDIEQALKVALRNRELELHYQPVIDVASG